MPISGMGGRDRVMPGAPENLETAGYFLSAARRSSYLRTPEGAFRGGSAKGAVGDLMGQEGR